VAGKVIQGMMMMMMMMMMMVVVIGVSKALQTYGGEQFLPCYQRDGPSDGGVVAGRGL